MWDKIWDKLEQVGKWFIGLIWALWGPPDIDEEAEFREWLDSALALFERMVKRTPTKVDDKLLGPVIDEVQAIIANDTQWLVLYMLLKKLLGDGRVIIGGPPPELGEDTDVAAAATRMGISIPLLIQIILLILKLLKRD
jgi:hypothetical protein